MSPIISVSLEYLLTHAPFEPVSISFTLPVASFHLGKPQGVPGVPILGLRWKAVQGEIKYILQRKDIVVDMPSDLAVAQGITHKIFRIHVDASPQCRASPPRALC